MVLLVKLSKCLALSFLGEDELELEFVKTAIRSHIASVVGVVGGGREQWVECQPESLVDH